MGRSPKSSQSWNLSSSRDDGSDIFKDSCFNGSCGDESSSPDIGCGASGSYGVGGSD